LKSDSVAKIGKKVLMILFLFSCLVPSVVIIENETICWNQRFQFIPYTNQVALYFCLGGWWNVEIWKIGSLVDNIK